ncbi:dihydroorotate dehydrogenase electron transfer subunit [Tissierella sp. Yu-01]|uniref:dihydroorotate dehydrogenase electron transfer subunit n=1 Tax=Tissierella sp. Yu-01 TaxID=3035694 RepID=UPI00240DD0E2|nr:dihydroorotate dehydrogenase electron transfer subunit [Tissierella sp. Yu-01]WFA08166.1 dihydroorotate dehydrogenase electron transfer subunit [Tissierella sp. Yu-01]
MREINKREKIQSFILENSEINPNIFRMIVSSNRMESEAIPGQFVNLYCKEGSRLLPRPISICDIDKTNNTLTLVYGVVGKGTKEFSNLKPGEYIDILGPLGNGYIIDKDIDKHILVGGGIGIPPLIELAKNLNGEKYVYLGFRSDIYLVSEFERIGAKVYIATDDGSYGTKGTVVDLLMKTNVDGGMVYSCGPKPMLKAVSDWAKEKGIKAQLSMEERMGCGIGTCVGCVCKIKKEDSWEYKRVCKDGPVFWSEEIVWNE